MTEAKKELMQIPGVGKSIADDLIILGYNRINDLKNENPQKMYDELCRITKSHQDRCLLYVFRCAVYFAEAEKPEPELIKWWNWSDENIEKAMNKK